MSEFRRVEFRAPADKVDLLKQWGNAYGRELAPELRLGMAFMLLEHQRARLRGLGGEAYAAAVDMTREEGIAAVDADLEELRRIAFSMPSPPQIAARANRNADA